MTNIRRLFRGRLIGNVALYSGTSIISRIIPFGLLPILVRYIDAAGFGHIAMFVGYQTFALIVCGLCADSVVMQQYYKVPECDRKNVEFSGYGMAALGFVILNVATLSLYPILGRYIGLSVSWMLMANVCALFATIQLVAQAIHQLRQQVLRYGRIQILNTIANATLSLILVVGLHLGWQGRLIGIVTSQFAIAAFIVWAKVKTEGWSLHDWKLVRPSCPFVQRSAKLGLTQVPGGVLIWGTGMIDRYFINAASTIGQVGVYSIGATFAQVAETMCNCIGQSIMPTVLERYNVHRKGVRALVIGILVVYVIIAIGWTFAGGLLLRFMTGGRYAMSIPPFIVLTFFYAVRNGNSLLSAIAFTKGRTYSLSAVYIIPFFTALVLNAFLVSRFGLVGAAYSSLGAGTLGFIVLASISRSSKRQRPVGVL